jgi:CMP-N-acetylneuraminic acid synthetase
MIAYIPARGGSKRLPRKNVLSLGGKPTLLHVIRALKKLSFIEAVCVSTDDPSIARIAEKAGCCVLGLRHPRLADDHTDFKTLFAEDLPRYLKYFSIKPSEAEVLFVLATAALVPSLVYQKAYQAYRRRKANVLVSVRPCPVSPFKALVQNKKGVFSPLFPEKITSRSQDLPEAFVDAGLFYFLNYAVASKEKRHWFLVPKGLFLYPVDESIAIDLDTPKDWESLKRAYQSLRK